MNLFTYCKSIMLHVHRYPEFGNQVSIVNMLELVYKQAKEENFKNVIPIPRYNHCNIFHIFLLSVYVFLKNKQYYNLKLNY